MGAVLDGVMLMTMVVSAVHRYCCYDCCCSVRVINNVRCCIHVCRYM